MREKIYEAALPLLRGRKVTDLVVGISLLAVELDGKDLAVSYVLRDELKGGCSAFPYACQTVGMDAEEAGRWFVTGEDAVQRAIGNAVLTAASRTQNLVDSELPFGLKLSAGDTVGMIGNIRPVAAQLKKSGCRMVIFDKGQCAEGCPEEDVYPMERQEELLAQCDVVFLSGTTTINGTIEPLLNMCKNARDVVLIGASTPMIPEGFAGTKVSVLAGSWWNHEDKDKIFRLISQASGINGLGAYMIKKNVRIKD